MDLTLKDFIANTLGQILEGIAEAQMRAEKMDKKGWISPPIVHVGKGEEKLSQTVRAQLPDGQQGDAHMFWFDVAVTASGKKGVEGGIKVAGMNIGGGVGKETSTVSRIKFTVPVFLSKPPKETSS